MSDFFKGAIDLSNTMASAVKHAKEHGGLVRQPGGSWVAPKDENDWSWSRVRFGGSTINGLVKRGLLVFTEHRDGRNGRFPIRAAIPTGDHQ
jgi:hypothetical protein